MLNARSRILAGGISARLRALAVRTGLMDYEKVTSIPSVDSWKKDYVTGRWDYLRGLEQMPRYSVLAGFASRLPHATILDVGCGVGTLREHLDHLSFESYVGIDPVDTAIDSAQRLADQRTSFLVGDVFLAGLLPFDIVVCNEVLYSLPKLADQLERICELLVPGGHLLTSNIRHPGDIGLYRLISHRFVPLDTFELVNPNRKGVRRRRISIYRRN